MPENTERGKVPEERYYGPEVASDIDALLNTGVPNSIQVGDPDVVAEIATGKKAEATPVPPEAKPAEKKKEEEEATPVDSAKETETPETPDESTEETPDDRFAALEEKYNNLLALMNAGGLQIELPTTEETKNLDNEEVARLKKENEDLRLKLVTREQEEKRPLISEEDWEKLHDDEGRLDRVAFAQFLSDREQMAEQRAVQQFIPTMHRVLNTRAMTAAFFGQPENVDIRPMSSMIIEVAKRLEAASPGDPVELLQKAANLVREKLGVKSNGGKTPPRFAPAPGAPNKKAQTKEAKQKEVVESIADEIDQMLKI